MPIGGMVGALLGGWIQDFAGRKVAFMTAGGLAIGGILVIFLSDRTPNGNVTFLCGKVADGLAVGVIGTSTQTYMSEIVPRRLRGPALAFFPIFTLFGQLVATGVSLALESDETKFSYRMAIATAWPFCLIPILLGIFVPESPSLLLRQEKTRSAWNSFVKLHGAETAAQCQDLFEEMRKAIVEERRVTEKIRYIDCFRGTNLRRTFIVVFANIIPDLFGLSMLGNATYFVQQLGMPSSMSFVVQLVGILLAMIANGGAFVTLLRFGRRTHILLSLCVVTSLWFGMGFTGIVEPSETVAWYVSAGDLSW